MSEITKQPTSTTEIVVPESNIAGVAQALSDLVATRNQLPELRARMEAAKCTTPQEYSALGLEVNHARAISKQGEAFIRPLLDKVKLVQDFLRTHLRTHEVEADAVAAVGAAKQAEYNRLERERTEREQKERDELNRKKAADEAAAELKRQQEVAAEKKDEAVKRIRAALKSGEITKREAEKMLKEAGAMEEAAKAKASADADDIRNNPKQETVLPNRTTVAGQRARAPLVYKIVDIDKIPRELLMPNRDAKSGEWKNADFPRLNQMVAKAKSEKEAEAEAKGGIKVWREDRV